MWLDIIERAVPFGEDAERSRRGLHRISDGCYDFWCAFVMPVVGDIEEGAGRVAADNRPDEMLATFMALRGSGLLPLLERAAQQRNAREDESTRRFPLDHAGRALP